MPYFIVKQLVRVGIGESSELVPMNIKTVGTAPNEQGKSDADGNVPDFIRIPPIIRVYIGNDLWGSPKVMPSHDVLDETPDDAKPKVWTLTLNPRNGNFNWHFGLGYGKRTDVDPRTGIPREEKFKPESGPARAMARMLGARIGEGLATQIVAMMVAEMIDLNERLAAAAAKKAEKAAAKAAKAASKGKSRRKAA